MVNSEISKDLSDDTDFLLRTTLEVEDGLIVCDSVWVQAYLLDNNSDKILDYERFSNSAILRAQPNWDGDSLVIQKDGEEWNTHLYENDFHRLLDVLARKDEKILAILKNLMGEVDYCDDDFMIHF